MASIEELVIQVKGDTLSAQSALTALNKQLSGLSGQKPKQDSFASSLKNNWMAFAAAALAAYQAIKQVIDFMKGSVTAAMAQEKVINDMSVAMRQVGVYSREALQHNIAFAEGLSKLAGIADDDIEKMQTLYTRFGATGDQLDALTKATVDFAAATGRDLATAADMVARSIQGTGDKVGRYDLNIKGAANSTERMNSIAKGLADTFGGAATRDAGTFEGMMRRLKVAGNELNESFGTALMYSVKPMLADMVKFTQSKEAIDGATTAGRALVTILEAIKLNLTFVTIPFRAIGVIGKVAFELVKDAIDPIKKTLEDVGKLLTPIVNFFKDTGERVINFVSKIGGKAAEMSPQLKIALISMKKEFTEFGKDVAAQVNTMYKTMTGVIERENSVQIDSEENKSEQTIEYSRYTTDTLIQMAKEFAEYQKTQKENQKLIEQTASQELLTLQKSVFSEIVMARGQQLDFELQKLSDERTAELAVEGLTKEQTKAINDKYAEQERQLKSRKWEEDKGWAIGQAIIDTAVAVTKALSAAPPPFNLILAGISGAAGGIQVGLISARQNPFNMADGGTINEPIRGYGQLSGREYNLGENGRETAIQPINNYAYAGASIVISNMTVTGGADDFINQLARRTNSRLFKR